MWILGCKVGSCYGSVKNGQKAMQFLMQNTHLVCYIDKQTAVGLGCPDPQKRAFRSHRVQEQVYRETNRRPCYYYALAYYEDMDSSVGIFVCMPKIISSYFNFLIFLGA